jgi:hypothetical protein
MNSNEALKIQTQLKGYYYNSDAYKNKEFLMKFHEYLLKLNFDRAEKAVGLVVREAKFFPTVAEFDTAYKNVYARAETIEKTSCETCEGNGFIEYIRVIEGHSYDFMAYCSNCSAGQQWEINTKNGYYTKPSSEILLDEFIRQNPKHSVQAGQSKNILHEKILEITKNLSRR